MAGTTSSTRCLWRWFVHLGAAASLFAIGCTDCPAGTIGCPCVDGETPCADGSCVAGRCEAPACAQGSLDCACYGNLTCDQTLDGRWMVCREGLCGAPSCPAGEIGCACTASGACSGRYQCDATTSSCQIPGCVVGDEGCGCHADRSCNAPATSQLACVQGICQQLGCEPGEPGCACLSNYACLRGNVCEAGLCQPITCTAGAPSCACRADGSCDGSLSCDGGRCVDTSCSTGAEGCTCRADFACDPGAAGSVLVCRGGRCASESCAAGTSGCACDAGGACEAGTACQQGVCLAVTCIDGKELCPCDVGRCEPGLYCAGTGVCLDGTGMPGASCRADGSCDAGAVCVAGTCTACLRGTQGCTCSESGSCSRGLACVDGLCVSEVSQSRAKPLSPVCYAPCRSDKVSATGVRRCEPQGLMAICRDGTSCVDGSCVPAGGAVPGCASDVDCPDFQACIRGRCYSDCDQDAECPFGTGCFRHVCRIECSESGAAGCPAGSSCRLVDGASGYCMPKRDPQAAAPSSPPQGTFTLEGSPLDYSNIRLVQSFRIHNLADRPIEYTIRKTRHTEYSGGSSTLVEVSPLPFLKLGFSAASAALVESLTVVLDGGASADVFAVVSTSPASVWDGELEVRSAEQGVQTLRLSYRESADGQWAGKMYYFADWADTTLPGGVPRNALIGRWNDLLNRTGGVTYTELESALLATAREDLYENGEGPDPTTICSAHVCYPYRTPSGALALGPYASSSDQEVPSGMTELPVAFNLATDALDPLRLVGRIDSGKSLHYPGDPGIALTFASDPSLCATPMPGPVGSCASLIDTGASSGASFVTGGRYPVVAGGSCDEAYGTGFVPTLIPWLVPGFTTGTNLDPTTGQPTRHECRDGVLPLGGESRERNTSFALANPVADGRSHSRELRIFDGALFNQEKLILFFEEIYLDSLLREPEGERFRAYGALVLERNAAELPADAFTPPPPVAVTRALPPDALLGVSCDPALVDRVFPGAAFADLTPSEIDALSAALLEGVKPGNPAAAMLPLGYAYLHYFCTATGLFGGGADLDAPIACPEGSPVTYFTVEPASSLDRATVAAHPCNQDGSCAGTLESWLRAGAHGIYVDPIYTCAASGAVFCDGNRFDLRAEKVFYASPADEPLFTPLRPAIEDAFRYRTRFANRDGSSVGFTPELCDPYSRIVPYCYDPEAIEEIRDRLDCLEHLFHSRYASLSATHQDQVRLALEQSFSYDVEPGPTLPVSNDGFERLYAQLLIMMGDDAYTRAFASRFDLAGSSLVSFPGSTFEPGGIDLSGAAGYEMVSLYQAVQYYELVLDRFAHHGPGLWASIGAADPSNNFVTQETVVAYFDRVVRAVVQKSRAWSQVAKRYMAFNRPDLARLVVERAYSAAYLEAMMVTRMMLAAGRVADLAKQAQIQVEIDNAQRQVRVAQLEMRDVYESIRDDVTYFGYAPDYIPFPALEGHDANSFLRTIARARTLAATAHAAEDLALASSRSYETDAAAFQAELVQIQNNYEGQLGAICGTMTSYEGRIVPAIDLYAGTHDKAKVLRQPCGLMGNGALFEAAGALESALLDQEKVRQQMRDLLASIEIERQRISSQCGLIVELADYQYAVGDEVLDLGLEVAEMQNAIAGLDRAKGDLEQISELTKCSVGFSTDCPSAAAASALWTAGSVAINAGITGFEVAITDIEGAMGALELDAARWTTLSDCTAAQIDSDAQTATLLQGLYQLRLDALKAEYTVKLAASRLEGLQNEAKRLQTEMGDAEQLRINIEVARNDPNVRIYKNDSIINADRTFENAIRAAYRATRVYEYFTATSYDRLDTLFLVRMVGYGDYSLNRYLDELEQAYEDFGFLYGTPQNRVEILSLRDDILQIPRVGEDNRALSDAERVDLFRAALQDPSRLNADGWRTVGFATRLRQLPALSRNHKIRYLEAEIVGTRVGDTLGYLTLRQAGTGVVQPLSGPELFYRFPERYALIGAFFNGDRVLADEVYRSTELRDRPVVNSFWELGLDQRTEHNNQDIDLGSLSDIRLYVYYTAFTATP